MGRHGGPKIDTAILREVEHADLIHYGLIPEFVGRLPVIVSLQVCLHRWMAATAMCLCISLLLRFSNQQLAMIYCTVAGCTAAENAIMAADYALFLLLPHYYFRAVYASCMYLAYDSVPLVPAANRCRELPLSALGARNMRQ